MAHKLIGVAIPTYDRRTYLQKLIATIPSDIGVYISDNGGLSTGVDFSGQGRCDVKVTKDLSMFENWNSALSIADCHYVAITSDDDLYLPLAFDCVKRNIERVDADVYVFGHHYIDQDDNVINSYSVDSFFVAEAPGGFEPYMYGVKARMPSIFFKRKFLKEIGYFDCSLFSFTAADSELIQRALLKGRVAFCPEIISCYRVWQGSFTDKKIATKEWLDQVESWTGKIIRIASLEMSYFTKPLSERYADEIYATNFYSGLRNLFVQKSYKEVLRFKGEARWPKHAFFKTKLRIIRLLLKAKILSYVS